VNQVVQSKVPVLQVVPKKTFFSKGNQLKVDWFADSHLMPVLQEGR